MSSTKRTAAPSPAPMTRKETFELLRSFAWCVKRAADHTSHNREYDELREIIARQERQHRALGRRMVGTISARMTVDQATDYFVAQCIVDGDSLVKRGAKLDALSGLRDDFVKGAILMADKRFAAELDKRIADSFKSSTRAQVFAAVKGLAYAALVATGDK